MLSFRLISSYVAMLLKNLSLSIFVATVEPLMSIPPLLVVFLEDAKRLFLPDV
jgi:hypothetical protein